MSFFPAAGSSYKAASIAGTKTNSVYSVPAATRSHGTINVGSAHAPKKAIAIVTLGDGAAGLDISTFTIGGIGYTEIVAQDTNFGGEYMRCIMCGFDLSSLAGVQTVSLVANQTINASGVSIVVVDDLLSIFPVPTGNSVTDTGASGCSLPAFSAPADGIAVAGGMNSFSTQSATWSSMTERSDAATDVDSPDHRHNAAWDLGERASGTETITWTGGSASCAVAAGFR